MNQPYYETFHEISPQGIQLSYLTTPGGYHPLHWHEELEILYTLNGEADIIVEGRKYRLLKRHIMVIESLQVHSTYAYQDNSMFICIHISKRYMQKYLPDIGLHQIHCIPEEIDTEHFPAYLEICKLMEMLTKLYMIENLPTFTMESEGIILQVFSRLLRFFSEKTISETTSLSPSSFERLRTIITYVEEHFRESISLQEGADQLGLTKEYFCRFFKKNMGLSFLEYINEVRITHVYHDLILTDTPISILIEENGFSNQKLFNRLFKKLYGCTPSSTRASAAVATKQSAASTIPQPFVQNLE